MVSMTVKFSIVIPLYNKEDTIERAITSILNQTYSRYEIIVVDDGSTDLSYKKVLQINDPRISIIKQRNQGVSSARNKGINFSSGVLIAFLDADDEWLPTHLETIINLYTKYPGAGAYTTNYLVNYPDGRIIQPTYVGIPPPPFNGPIHNYFKTLFEGDPPICASTACIPKEIFGKVGLFPLGEQMGEDLDMWGRIALEFDIVFDWTIGAIWHIGPNKPLCTKLEPFVKTATRVLETSEVKKDYIVYLEKYIEKKILECATNNISSGDFSTARKLLLNNKMKNYFLQKIFWLLITLFPVQLLKFLKLFKKTLYDLTEVFMNFD